MTLTNAPDFFVDRYPGETGIEIAAHVENSKRILYLEYLIGQEIEKELTNENIRPEG